jgi:hypothetical protein
LPMAVVLLLLFFLTGSFCVIQAGFELMTFLPLPSLNAGIIGVSYHTRIFKSEWLKWITDRNLKASTLKKNSLAGPGFLCLFVCLFLFISIFWWGKSCEPNNQ